MDNKKYLEISIFGGLVLSLYYIYKKCEQKFAYKLRILPLSYSGGLRKCLRASIFYPLKKR